MKYISEEEIRRSISTRDAIEAVKKGATISCVGTYEPGKHEIDPALIARADKIYCDNKAAVLSESGERQTLTA